LGAGVVAAVFVGGRNVRLFLLQRNIKVDAAKVARRTAMRRPRRALLPPHPACCIFGGHEALSASRECLKLDGPECTLRLRDR